MLVTELMPCCAFHENGIRLSMQALRLMVPQELNKSLRMRSGATPAGRETLRVAPCNRHLQLRNDGVNLMHEEISTVVLSHQK